MKIILSAMRFFTVANFCRKVEIQVDSDSERRYLTIPVIDPSTLGSGYNYDSTLIQLAFNCGFTAS